MPRKLLAPETSRTTVNLLPQSWLIRGGDHLLKPFARVKRDGPSYCFPDQGWLRGLGKVEITYGKHLSDLYVNYSLMLWKIQILALNPFLQRRSEFPLVLHDASTGIIAL